MKTGADVRKEQILYVVLGVMTLCFCIYLYEELFATGSSTVPPPQTVAVSAPRIEGGAASGPDARKIGTTSAALDPTLHMGPMLVSEAVEYSGTGRNIFSPDSAPTVVIPVPIAKARPGTQVQAQAYVAPVRTGPPPPPPIDLKYFGVETQENGRRVALLLHGDDVYTASAGEVVAKRYKVIAVGPKTMQVEDMQNKNQQTLPLLVN